MDTEKLLEEAADHGTLLGRGKSSKGAHYAAFKHTDGRIFVGVYTDGDMEYVCGAEQIPETELKSYIG